MESFTVSARKYRPATFESVVGQQHITNTLRNAIKSNQLAQAFLFCGPRGVGKTTCARILAKTINCQDLPASIEPCGKCESCRSFQNGNSFNIHELDAASNNSVDDIRSLIEQVRIPPQAGKYKIYIIDEVHMLSQAAFNAFLKTLEEPPSYAIFILATTEKHKILPTILSRCQIFDFNRIRVEDMANHLASIAEREQISFDNDGLHLIAQKADGGLRDALSMFDQIASFSNRDITYKAVIENLNILDYDYYFKLTAYLLDENVAQTLIIFDTILSNGFDGNNFITGLASHFRNLLVGKDVSTLKLLEVSEGIRQKYLQQSQATSASFLLSALSIANQCDLNYKQSKNQRLQVELALIKMCHISSAINLANLPIEGNSEREQKKKPDTPAVESGEKEAANPVFLTERETEGTLEDPEATDNENIVKVTIEPEKQVGNKIEEQLPAAGRTIKPAVVIAKPSLMASAALIPNLNDLSESLQLNEPDKPQYITGESRQDFTREAFFEFWNEYAAKAKTEAKLNLFTIMTSNPPALLPDFNVEVLIENKIQHDLLNLEKIDLLNFLRVKLQNFAIDIIPKQLEQTARKRLYTSNEKYQHMVEKNPALEEFRRRFNLGIE